MQSTGFTVNCIDWSATSTSATVVSGTRVNNKNSARGIMSEAESKPGEIAENIPVVDDRARCGTLVEAFVFTDK